MTSVRRSRRRCGSIGYRSRIQRCRLIYGRRWSRPVTRRLSRSIRSIGSCTRAGSRLRDLIWQRSGELPRVPDVIVRPGAEDEVIAVLQAAMRLRRRRDPVRRRLVDLGLIGSARRRDATGDLGRSRAPGQGARDRQRLATRARAGRCVRSPPREAARGGWVHVRPLPRLVHALDTWRLDRHALLGDAIRPLRGHRGHGQRPARRHPIWNSGYATRTIDLDRTERPGDGARQRGAPRDHHRGDGAHPADS